MFFTIYLRYYTFFRPPAYFITEVRPVQVTEAVTSYVLSMEKGAVAFVSGEIVGRILFCDPHHIPIASNFRHDGGKRDDWFGLVTSDDRLLTDIRSRSVEKAVKTDFYTTR